MIVKVLIIWRMIFINSYFNNRPKGTFIAYDYATIHRAKPYNGGQVRTSMFGQLSPSRMPVGEPILLNTRDLNGPNKEAKRGSKLWAGTINFKLAYRRNKRAVLESEAKIRPKRKI